MELYNVKTRQREDINDPEALQNAILSGTHSYKTGSKIPALNPEGDDGFIPSENVAEAIKAGYRIKTGIENQAEAYADENDGIGGAIKTFGMQALDESALGIPEMVADATQDPLEVAKREEMKKRHAIANTAGGITGFGVSLLYGGPLWKGASKAGAKVSSLVAEKIVAKSGGEVSKSMAKRIARGMLEKTAPKVAGGAVEGVIATSPIAITEAALGDPDAAAESILAGMGVGGIFGGVMGAGSALGKPYKDMKKMLSESDKIRDLNAQAMARKAAKVMTGVPEDDIAYYIKNHDRVNSAMDNEAIKDMLDEGVLKFSSAVDDAAEQLAFAKEQARQSYAATRQQFSQKQAPQALADDIMGTMDQQKAVLGDLSSEADDLLAASGLTFRKNDLVKFLDDVGGAIGTKSSGGGRVLVSDEAQTAANKLFAQRNRIKEGFGDEITAPELRSILREVRKDINFNQMAGEFNDTLNQARKKFTERISGVLKNQVDGYEPLMARMADISENLGQMSKNFGKKERAISSLNQAVTTRGEVKLDALKRFDELTGRQFVSDLDELKQAKTLLAEMRVKNIADKVTPEAHAELLAAESRLANAKEAFAQVKRLSPQRTQNIIRQQGFKNASIEDRRALEALGRDMGEDLETLIRDRNVLNQFDKEFTNGSRRTLLGAILGDLVGGSSPLGVAIGGSAGAAADVYGGTMLKKLIDGNLGVAGVLFAEKSMAKTAKEIDRIPGILSRMAKGTKEVTERSRAASVPAIIRLFKEDSPKHMQPAAAAPSQPMRTLPVPKLKPLKRLQDENGVLANNPQALMDRLAELTEPFTNSGAPMTGASLSARMAGVVNYINQIMPKPPKPQSPFAPQVEWEASDYEMAAFNQKLDVVMDPFVALDELEAGTLTKNHINALKTVYPVIFTAMQKKVLQTVTEGVEPVPYADRVKLSMLMQTPMDPTMEQKAIMGYQAAFNAQGEIEDGSQMEQAMPQGVQIDLAQGAQTQAQRLLGG